MTAEAIVRRNRENARRSTGPRTAAGKAVVAGNARRHGAQSKPDPERVALWLRVILDRQDVSVEKILAGDEKSLCALALASAEARLAACETACRECEAGLMPSWENIGLREYGSFPREGHAIVARSLLALLDAGPAEPAQDDGRQTARQTARLAARPGRLLKRYRGEARARRNRAFRAWIGCLDAQAQAAAMARKRPNPETNPDSPAATRAPELQIPETKPDSAKTPERRIPETNPDLVVETMRDRRIPETKPDLAAAMARKRSNPETKPDAAKPPEHRIPETKPDLAAETMPDRPNPETKPDFAAEVVPVSRNPETKPDLAAEEAQKGRIPETKPDSIKGCETANPETLFV